MMSICAHTAVAKTMKRENPLDAGIGAFTVVTTMMHPTTTPSSTLTTWAVPEQAKWVLITQLHGSVSFGITSRRKPKKSDAVRGKLAAGHAILLPSDAIFFLQTVPHGMSVTAISGFTLKNMRGVFMRPDLTKKEKKTVPGSSQARAGMQAASAPVAGSVPAFRGHGAPNAPQAVPEHPQDVREAAYLDSDLIYH